MVDMKKTILYKNKGKNFQKPIEILDDPRSMGAVSSDLALEIIKSLSKESSYPKELAKKLKHDEQKIYYHIRNLSKAGFIEVVSEEMKYGAVCKYYSTVSDAFGFELGSGGEIESEKPSNPKIREFFHDFIRKGVFDGSIVVGSPQPHGPYNTEAKDGYYLAHLGMFLGSLCTLEDRFIVKTDTETKAEQSLKRNMILVGGPIVNTVISDINEKMSVKFTYNKGWSIKSEKEAYSDERDVLVARIRNPWDPTKVLIVISGLKSEGTKTGIIAITQYYEKLLKSFDKNKDFYCVFRGLDKDGDGKVDDIQVLETV